MKRFVITPRAAADLAEIEEYISRDSPSAARRVIGELRQAMRKLTEMPNLGHRRPDIPDERYRFWTVYSYLVVYNPSTSPLLILRVIHGHRDIPRVIGYRVTENR